MDNASFHKGRKLQELLKKAGHYLVLNRTGFVGDFLFKLGYLT